MPTIPKPSPPRTYVLRVRLSDAEHRALTRTAKRHAVTVAAYARYALDVATQADAEGRKGGL